MPTITAKTVAPPLDTVQASANAVLRSVNTALQEAGISVIIPYVAPPVDTIQAVMNAAIDSFNSKLAALSLTIPAAHVAPPLDTVQAAANAALASINAALAATPAVSPATFLPAIPGVGATWLSMHATRQALAGYTGPTRRIVKTTGGATLAIPLNLTTGDEDRSGVSAFLSGDTSSHDIWYDQSGNARHALQTTDSLRMPYQPSNQETKAGAITGAVTKDTGTLVNPGPRFSRDATLSTARNNVTWIQVIKLGGAPPGAAGLGGLGVSGTANNNLELYTDNGGDVSPLQVLSNGFPTFGTPPAGRWTVVTVKSNGSALVVRINGAVTSNSAATAQALTGGRIGAGTWAAITQGCADHAFDAVASIALTDPEITIIETALMTMFGIAAPTKIIGWDADSITANMTTYMHGWLWQTNLLLNSQWYMPDFGRPSQTTQDMYNRRAATAARINSLATTIGATVKAVHCMPCSESVNTGSSAVTTWTTYLLPYIQYMKSQGLAVICATMIPRNWSGVTQAAGNTERLALNVLIRNNAVAEGYTVDDVGAIALLSTGAANDPVNFPTYYADAAHPNGGDAYTIGGGFGLMAPITAPLINALG